MGSPTTAGRHRIPHDPSAPHIRHIVLIGYGAMGRYVHGRLESEERVKIRYVLVRPDRVRSIQDELGDRARAIGTLDDIEETPDFALECAGHTAVTGPVLQLLAQGIDTIMASVGALSRAGVPEQLEQAALRGAAQLILPPGAVAGIDALAAARLEGLDAVSYVGRKSPMGWMGTPAERLVDLATLTQPAELFAGSAREAAALYPKNANVAAIVGLAGIGMDRTQVHLIADPGVSRNTHTISASGKFGELEIRTSAETLPDNPKTSMLAALSIVRAVRNRIAPIAV